jgi:YD repeat-containing protein
VRFDRQSGEALGALTYDSDRPVAFRDVAVAANGDLVALNHFSEFVRFDAAGNVLHVVDIEEAATVLGVSKLALDGVGNVYMLGTYQDALGKRQNGVFLFSSDGRYLSRFGSNGDEPGQFTSPGAIAVDGQGRIYVSDFPGIITFSNSGSYLGTTDTEGFVHGIDFDSQGRLVAVGNANKLFRYALPAAE